MYKHRKKIVAGLAGFLAVLMILSIVAMALPASAAEVSESSLNELKRQQSALSNEKKSLEGDLSNLKSQERSALAEKSNLENQLSVLEQQIATSEQLIAALDDEIAAKEQEIAAAVVDEEEEFALYKKRVRAMEESSHVSTWAVLLGATSFSDFLARMEVVRDIVAYDTELMASLKSIREGIEALKEGLEEDRAFNESVKAELELQRVEATEKSVEVDALLDEIEQEKTYTEEEIAKLADEIIKADQEIDRMIKELAKRSTYVGGDYLWPLPYPYRKNYITQGFKYRVHQITKVYSLHNGVDIGAPKGTEISAANTGTVIISEYSKAWGEYVVIDHGGGNETLYAHMSKRLVSVNDEVAQGDVIGLVGSTGYSTGNHLHFTIYVNDKSVDPMKYFS